MYPNDSTLEERFKLIEKHQIKFKLLHKIYIFSSLPFLFLVMRDAPNDYPLYLMAAISMSMLFHLSYHQRQRRCPHCLVRSVKSLCACCGLPSSQSAYLDAKKKNIDINFVNAALFKVKSYETKCFKKSLGFSSLIGIIFYTITKTYLKFSLDAEIVVIDDFFYFVTICLVAFLSLALYFHRAESFKKNKLLKEELKLYYWGIELQYNTQNQEILSPKHFKKSILFFSFLIGLISTFSLANLEYIAFTNANLLVRQQVGNEDKDINQSFSLEKFDSILLVRRRNSQDNEQKSPYLLMDSKTANGAIETMKVRIPSSIEDSEAEEIMKIIGKKTKVNIIDID